MRKFGFLAAVVLVLAVLLGACGGAHLPPPAPIAQGVAAGPLWQDAAILQEADRLIQGAKSRVLVEMYEFGRDDLRSDLASAAGRGAQVRTLLDPTVDVSVATGHILAGGGVPVRWYPVDAARGQIDHVKLLVADDVALVGGMNWGATSGRNHDYALELGGRAVAEAVSVFEYDWALAGGLPSRAPVWDAASVLAETTPGDAVRSLISRALATNPRSIEIEMYSFTESGVVLGLTRAVRAGARVRVLLDPHQPEDVATARLLAAGGVEVRRYPTPAHSKLHAKIGLFGDRLILGSANWSEHGLGINHELDATTTDPAAIAAYERRFEADWERSG